MRGEHAVTIQGTREKFFTVDLQYSALAFDVVRYEPVLCGNSADT
jgi:hypothetical protein